MNTTDVFCVFCFMVRICAFSSICAFFFICVSVVISYLCDQAAGVHSIQAEC